MMLPWPMTIEHGDFLFAAISVGTESRLMAWDQIYQQARCVEASPERWILEDDSPVPGRSHAIGAMHTDSQ